MAGSILFANRTKVSARSGCFVVVEGLDFSGKSTVCSFLIDEFRSRGRPAICNSLKNRALRNLSKRLESTRVVPAAAPDALYVAAVLHDVVNISLWLRRGLSVVQDRHFGSYIWHESVVRVPPRLARADLYRALQCRTGAPDVTIYCRSSLEKLNERYHSVRSGALARLSPNDRALYASGASHELANYRRAFDDVAADLPNLVSVRNDGSLDELRVAIRDLVGDLVASRPADRVPAWDGSA